MISRDRCISFLDPKTSCSERLLMSFLSSFFMLVERLGRLMAKKRLSPKLRRLFSGPDLERERCHTGFEFVDEEKPERFLRALSESFLGFCPGLAKTSLG